MAIKPTIEVSTLVAAQPQEVWAALTTPEIIKTYFFGADVETDWREGSPIRFAAIGKARSSKTRAK